MANETSTIEVPNAPTAQNTADLWADEESEEIITVPKKCAYDPLTRL